MSLVDRFICRREGHQPTLVITDASSVTSALCTCARCGKWVEARLPAQAGAEDPATPQKGAEPSAPSP